MFRLGKVGLALASLLLVLVGLSYAGAEEPANQYFERTWATTDQPVSELIVSRTWMWGPEANTGPMFESYVEAPGGEREVQYFDKSRMEITHPDRDSSTVWYVTNGLLVVELITGQMQFGDNTFEQRQPAQVNVAGDADDPNGPTYAGFGEVLDANPAPVGAVVNQRITREGDVSTDDSLDENGILIGSVDEVTNHSIAEPFWEFMNSSGVVYQNGEYVSAQLFDPPQFATGHQPAVLGGRYGRWHRATCADAVLRASLFDLYPRQPGRLRRGSWKRWTALLRVALSTRQWDCFAEPISIRDRD